MKKLLLTIFIIAIPLLHFGQRTLGSAPVLELEAFERFQERKYYDVKKELEKKQSLTSNEQLILYLSNLKVGEDGVEELKQWLKDHRNHPLRTLGLFHYAEFMFYQGEVVASKTSLKKVKASDLGSEDRLSYAYMAGIMAVNDGRYPQAKKQLTYALTNGFESQKELAYYLGYTSYHLGEMEAALKYFKQSITVPFFKNSSSYFMTLIYLETEELDQAVEMAQRELSTEKTSINSGLYQLLGEAYAKQGQGDKADAYFEKAIELHPEQPSSALYYQAGVSKFKIGNTEKALEFLTQSGIGSGPYAKLSAFQLGRLHVQRKEPEAALNAYIEASTSEDLAIKEESMYQVTKLSAKVERYSEAIDYGSDYTEAFEQGQWKDEIQDLMAICYLKTSNYDQAIVQLERTGITNKTQQEVYQKVTYQKAMLHFNDGDFDRASDYFSRSLKFPSNAQLSSETYFYLGEIYLRRENYGRALSSYQRVSPRTAEASYGMAYALYNQRKYEEAISHFTAAGSLQEKELREDAKLRLADCLYATKRYSSALLAYENTVQTDYVFFQKGMVLRNLDRNEEAARSLDQIPSASRFKDDGLFYKALIFSENAQFEAAENGFTSLINRYEGSNYIPAGLLNRGISRNNLGKYELAKQDYERVIDQYLQSEEAFSAILGLQDLQQKGISVPDLDNYIASYKQANPNDGSLEVVEFEAAKSVYFDFDYSNATTKIKKFLNDYPQSKFRTEATYYLGDAFFRLDQLQEARTTFDDQRFLRNRYTGRILFRLGEINLTLADYDRAIEDLKLLLALDLSPRDNYNARDGLMRAHYNKVDYAQTIIYADQIIASDWKPLNAAANAKLIKASCLLKLDQPEEGKSIYSELAFGEDQLAAEASYRLALLDYESGRYDQSLEALFDLTSKFGSYTDWVEKAYLLIAENYIAKEELFQAKATLRSIVLHSQNEATVLIASEKLRQIEENAVSDTTKMGNE